MRATRISILLLGLLLIANFFIWNAVLQRNPSHELTVSFLDVGQGDSIFIESPTGVQVLIDAGRDGSALRELSSVMRWNDRTINLVIATHPDADHIGGIPDVLDRFEVAYMMESSVLDDGPDYEALQRSVQKEQSAARLTAMRGQVIDIGGAYIEILFPDRPLTDIETNTGSIIARLVYGETSFLLTGDAPESIESLLLQLDGEKLGSDVLKAGHHGSRTSSSEAFVRAVGPAYAVISRGCDNTYGHPHTEVTQVFAAAAANVLDTCTEGTITFVSDGREVKQQQ